MSFIMDVARSARVKFLDEHGHEQVDGDDPYLFLRLEAGGPASASQKRKGAKALSDGGEENNHSKACKQLTKQGPATGCYNMDL